ncbi:MAG: protease modulator HflK, partial [Proteobacteria bacterium]|nr:protease modulator HflK [Pseudomonadota bacterium]
ADESAVAYVFGRAVARDVLPGIHWNPPWPFGRVTVEKTATNFFMPIGYRVDPRKGPHISSLWLTGDTNLLTIRLNVQFSIGSLTKFEIAHEAPRDLLRRVAEGALTRFLMNERVDAVLGARRAELRAAVRQDVQAALEREGVGVTVQSVTVEELAPPLVGGVRGAFQGVQSASADRERLVLEARSYRRQILAEAEGEAERLRAEAKAARHRRVELAHGEAERFRAIAREHARAPAVTEQRLYLETLERLLPGLESYVVEADGDGRVNLRIVR